jgi:hypothetical protein
MSAIGNAALSNLGSYILAWLLSQRDGGTPHEITKALQALREERGSDPERRRAVDEEVVALTQTGRVTRVRKATLVLTASGRNAAVADLGSPKLPANADWRRVKARYQSVVLRRWFDSSANAPAVPQENASPAPVAPAWPPPVKPLIDLPQDDAAFAARVLAAARASKTGRFGDDKVFISHVLQQLTNEGARVNDAEEFKDRLVSVHRRELLSLSRADLVEAMDSKDVAASETRYLNATFHFVRV